MNNNSLSIAKVAGGLLSLIVGVAFLCLCSLLIGGCAATSPAATTSANTLQWPPQPQSARVVWVREVRNGEDAGIAKGFWRKVSDFIFGSVSHYIGKPYGVFSDDAQRLYVVDVGRAIVHVMDKKQGNYWTIGEKENKGSVFVTPIAVTADDSGCLYITDSGKGVVFRYRLADRKLEPFIFSGLQRPTGIAFSRGRGLIFVSDTLTHQVLAYSLDGALRFRIGGRGDEPGYFNYPTDLFVDGQGRLVVTDALNNRIQVFRENGAFVGAFGMAGDSTGYLAKPKGVAVDSDGNIYVVDALLDAVQIFNLKGEILLDFGDHGTGPGQFWLPSGIYIDKEDSIFVADSYNHRVQVFRYLRQQKSEPGMHGATGNGNPAR